MVVVKRLELLRHKSPWVLSPLRLPIPPHDNMVGAARLERAMIVTCALVTIAPRCAGLCIPVPPSAYKIPNQSLEKYSSVLAPASSMLFLARPMSYRTSHVLSIVELFTQSGAAYPSVTAAVKYCREPLCYGNVCGTTQYVTGKELAFADCVSVYTTSKTRHCYYKAHCRIRALGTRTL